MRRLQNTKGTGCMPKKNKRFADDGWAFWVEGDDTSTVYINDWLNPKGKSFVDVAFRIRGVKISSKLSVYIPFPVAKDEFEDVSLLFSNKNIFQASFSVVCVFEYMKNKHTSEAAYNGKTIDIVHISTIPFSLTPLSSGTLLEIDLKYLHPYLDNDEAYFIWRIPHKSLDEVFRPHVDVRNLVERFRDLITTPVVAEKYGYSIRINESRLLPEEINRIGSFHRQKLKKAVVSLTIDESYELNDAGCDRIRRLEANLYGDSLPQEFPPEDAITYRWTKRREHNLLGQFNFYYNITRNAVSGSSMLLYMVLFMAFGVIGNLLSDLIKMLFGLFL